MAHPLSIVLALLGTSAGVVYAALGHMALRHLREATEVDRAVGWSLWWFAERDRYNPEGQRLCRLGLIAFVVGTASWLAWAFFRGSL